MNVSELTCTCGCRDYACRLNGTDEEEDPGAEARAVVC